MMKKTSWLCTGFSLVSVAILIVALTGTHGTVAYVSCDYCKVKEIASVQSDSLDASAEADVKKADMLVADDKVYINKLKTSVAITDSFIDTNKKVDDYAAKERSAEGVSITDDIELAHELFKQYDQTKAQYQLAANTLINASHACLVCGKTSQYQHSRFSEVSDTVRDSTAEDGEQFCESGQRSLHKTIA